jgi:hypothetical protein
VSNFIKVKWHFYLFMILIQGVSLRHFHVYMYYDSNWLIASLFCSFYLSPPLSTGLKTLYSFLYRKYINHIHLLNFLLLPSLSRMWLPLARPVFSNYCCICIRSIFHRCKRTYGFWPSETILM